MVEEKSEIDFTLDSDLKGYLKVRSSGSIK